MDHEWLDLKGAATTSKTPGAYWTYYRCKGCGKIVEEKTTDECSGVAIQQPLPVIDRESPTERNEP